MNKRLEFINLVADVTTTWLVCKSWIIVAGLFCLTVSSASAEQAMPQGVLIMDDSGGAAAGPFYPAIVSGLRNSVNRDPSNQYSIYVESLDFHRFHGPEYELSLKQFFITKYKDHPIEVIVAVGVRRVAIRAPFARGTLARGASRVHIRRSTTSESASGGCDRNYI